MEYYIVLYILPEICEIKRYKNKLQMLEKEAENSWETETLN